MRGGGIIRSGCEYGLSVCVSPRGGTDLEALAHRLPPTGGGDGILEGRCHRRLGRNHGLDDEIVDASPDLGGLLVAPFGREALLEGAERPFGALVLHHHHDHTQGGSTREIQYEERLGTS